MLKWLLDDCLSSCFEQVDDNTESSRKFQMAFVFCFAFSKKCFTNYISGKETISIGSFLTKVLNRMIYSFTHPSYNGAVTKHVHTKKQDENFDINKRDSTEQTFEQDRTQQRPLFHPQKNPKKLLTQLSIMIYVFCFVCFAERKNSLERKKKRNNVDTKLIKLDTHERDNRKGGRRREISQDR